MVELEYFLLKQYARVDNVDHGLVDDMFDNLVDNDFDMNSVGAGGPLFCLILDMRPILRIGVVMKMVAGGLDFSHKNTFGIAHQKLVRDLEIRYSDTLWGVFVYICQNTNFVSTLPSTEMFDIFFGRILVTKMGVRSEYAPHVCVFNIMLKYDTNKRIKRAMLKPINFSLRHCVRQRFPLILNAILDS